MGGAAKRIRKFRGGSPAAARDWQRDAGRWRYREVFHLRAICAERRHRNYPIRRLARVSRQPIVAGECIIETRLAVALSPPESAPRRVSPALSPRSKNLV